MKMIDVESAQSERLTRLRVQAVRARAAASVVPNTEIAKALSVEAIAIDALIDRLVRPQMVGIPL